jgi:hypothetical protein
MGKLKMRIFKETVHEDDELAHASGHGDKRLFPCRQETLIKGFKNAVITHGIKSYHVESLADRAATTTNGTDAFLGAAILIIRSHPARAAAVCLLSVPSSGISARMVAAMTGPTPGMACKRLALCASGGLWAINAAMA